MKKWSSILLIIAMTLSVLSGCMGDSPKGNEAKSNEKSTNDTTKPAGTSDNSGTDSSGKTYAEQHIDEWPVLKVRMTNYLQTGNFTPTEDVLTPIWREKTKVIPETVTSPGSNPQNAVQQWLAADNLPQVFVTIGVGQGTDNYKLLKTNKKLREITLEDVKKYMPRFTAWLTEEGGNIEDWYNDNIDPEDGKLWDIPIVSGLNLPGYEGTRALNETNLGMAPYYFYIRDDVLKKVFPNAKTESELVEMYKQQGGNLSHDDLFGDIPIDSMDDLLKFYQQVQSLNLTVNNKPVYAQLQSSSQNINSTLWSMFSINGYLWWQLGERQPKGENLTYTPITPEWKEYYRWWNTIYTNKLIDPETFIQKDDQMNSKAISGQYYIINQWGPVADARRYAKDNNLNYGYRIVPYFRNMSLINKYADIRPRPVNMDGQFGAFAITTEVSDKDFPQIMNWFDWNMSKEAAELRTWGLPEWSTGTGDDRRFKPEYQAIADWEVYGIPSDKDGNYYGMYDMNTNPTVGPARWNSETYSVQGLLYKDAPVYVYPPKLDGEVNLDNYILLQMNNHIRDQSIFFHQKGFTFAQLDPGNKFTEVDNRVGVYSADAKGKIVKMITGKPADFDKNWDGYMSLYTDEWKNEFKLMQDRWKEVWNKHILPELEKDPKWKPAE